MDAAWDDIRTILMLVRHGSLAGAANALGVNYTTVARRVRRAEDTLNRPLFERHPEGYHPNDAAHLIAEHAGRMEDAEHDMMRRLQGIETGLSGTLTITAPLQLISNFLPPFIDQFTRDHPQIDLRILASAELLDLSRREADLAIRFSQNPGDTLKGLRLIRQETASFANSDWAARIASDRSTLIEWIVYRDFPNVPKDVSPDFPNNRVRLVFDDMVAIAGAAQAGLGVVRMPLFLGRTTTGLEQVPPLPPQPYRDIWVVGHPDVWKSAKVRAFLDPLVAYCKARRDLFVS